MQVHEHFSGHKKTPTSKNCMAEEKKGKIMGGFDFDRVNLILVSGFKNDHLYGRMDL